MSRQQKPIIDRVMAKIVRVPIAGCWIFTGALNEAGYGIIGRGGRGAGNDRAHRVTYEHFVGTVPAGLFVCHHCDQPACCNPEHLFLGTNAQNMEDCRSKGRASRPPRNDHVVGEVHPGAKLTAEKVVEMRRLRAAGWTEAALGARYGVHPVSVHKIVHRLRWRHVA